MPEAANALRFDPGEARLRQVVEHAPIPVMLHDESGTVLHISREWTRLTGYGPDDIPTVAEWARKAYGDRAAAAHAAIRAAHARPAGAVFDGGEFHVRTASGEERVWLFRAASTGRGHNGRNVLVSMAVDVTESRSTLAALSDSEARLRLAQRVGRFGSYDLDVERGLRIYSEEYVTIHGLASDIRSEPLEAFFARVHPEDRERVREYMNAATDPEPTPTIEYRIVRASDGRVRWVAERREALRGEGGRLRIVGAQQDITEALESQAAFRESEARLRLASEAGQVGLFDWDLRANVLVWDERLRAIWGLDPGVPVAVQTFFAGVHPADVERLQALIAASHDPSGDGHYEAEYRVVSARGDQIRHVSARGRTTFENGRAIRMMGMAVDVTALREAQAVLQRDHEELERLIETRTRDLNEARNRLAQSQRMEALGQLAGGIAHDFNNVLQAVETGADLIEQRADPKNFPRYVRMLRQAARRGSAITKRLLAFSRRGELRAESVTLAPMLREIQEILRHTLDPGIQLRVKAAADLPPIHADRRQLETVLINLANNSRDALGGNGQLTFAAELVETSQVEAVGQPMLSPGRYIKISVIDNGCGMSPDQLAHAAEPFFTTKPPGQGTGLGLSMARGFAQQSRGGFRIDSAPGDGATVSLWLPVETEGAKAVDAPAHVKVSSRTARILVVDDDALVRELLAEQLRASGYEAIVARNGAEALERLSNGETIDLTVTDFSMPGINGIAFVREARRLRPGLPAILLTGFVTDAADLAAGDSLAHSFALLRKPIERDELVARIALLLGEG